MVLVHMHADAMISMWRWGVRISCRLGPGGLGVICMSGMRAVLRPLIVDSGLFVPRVLVIYYLAHAH